MSACVVCGQVVDLDDPEQLRARGLYELRWQREDPTFRLRDDVHHGDCHVRLGFREAREAVAASRAVPPPTSREAIDGSDR